MTESMELATLLTKFWLQRTSNIGGKSMGTWLEDDYPYALRLTCGHHREEFSKSLSELRAMFGKGDDPRFDVSIDAVTISHDLKKLEAQVDEEVKKHSMNFFLANKANKLMTTLRNQYTMYAECFSQANRFLDDVLPVLERLGEGGKPSAYDYQVIADASGANPDAIALDFSAHAKYIPLEHALLREETDQIRIFLRHELLQAISKAIGPDNFRHPPSEAPASSHVNRIKNIGNSGRQDLK